MDRIDRNFYLKNARDALIILKESIGLHRQGSEVFYKVIALQLRLLLCDTTRRHGKIVDVSLLPRLAPNLMFYPMNFEECSIDREQQPMLLYEWLLQMPPIENVNSYTLKELIRKICDQYGGVHVDPKPNSGLFMREEYIEWLVTIGEYVVELITPYIM